MTEEPFGLAALVLCRTDETPRVAETLRSLAAQNYPDVEIHVIVADGEPSQMGEMRELVGAFEEEFSTRVDVVDRTQIGSQTPFGAGIARARASYVAALYPDDVVLAHWAETFARHGRRAGGRALSSLVRTQALDEVSRASGRIVTTTPGPPASEPMGFDLMEHVAAPPLDLRGFALPRLTVQRVVVQPMPPAAEGWAVRLAVGLSCGLVETGVVTQLRRPAPSTAPPSLDEAQWADDRRAALQALGRCGLAIGPDFFPSLESSVATSRAQLEVEVGLLRVQLQRAEDAVAVHAAAERRAREQVAELLSSASWRASAPLRALSEAARRRGRSTRR